MSSSESAPERILEAAGRLFAERGFSETSIQRLADEAQVNRALIFYYFHSKEELYRRLVEDMCQAVDREFAQTPLPQADPEARLRAWVTALCVGMSHHPGVLRILLREAVGPGHARLPVGQYLEGAEGPLREILSEGVAAGVFRNLDPAMTAISLMGLVMTFIRRGFAYRQEFPAEVVAEHVLTLTLEGLRLPASAAP